ncbi:MAG: iron ABC transporter permease [Lachnospiraceae bacterium]|nr:iron ABC transporter permease [Lachnospiraceae bacterium]
MEIVKRTKKIQYIIVIILILGVCFFLSLSAGKFPLHVPDLFRGDETALSVFWTLRFPRSCMAVIAGFGLGVVGIVYQTIFQNPLAAPDIIGVSAGACGGAAFGILFCAGGTVGVTLCAFAGSVIAVISALGLSMVVRGKSHLSIVLSGLAVQSLAQTVLMMLKLMADPEKELAAIEYWIMGSLNAITAKDIMFPIGVTAICMMILICLYRQIFLLSLHEDEATLLGVSVGILRLVILLLATLVVAAIVSVTGVIGFVGLVAPHCARLLLKNLCVETLVLSGLIGSVLLLVADILARTVAKSELPVSVFTSLIGVPFLVWLMVRKEKN